jgi:isomerase DpgB
MVTRQQADAAGHDAAGHGDLTLRVDGSRPLAPQSVAALAALCGAAEDAAAQAATGPLVVVRVAGVPDPDWPDGLSVALVSKWERGLRRLERLPAATIAVADGDCGGLALDALLVADYRVMLASARLVLPSVAGATWPGMALYRLARQAAGSAPARAAVLFGRPIGAAEALRAGIVDDVADDPSRALDQARAAVGGEAAGPELAIRRQLMLEAAVATFEDALGPHLAACDRMLRSMAPGAV